MLLERKGLADCGLSQLCVKPDGHRVDNWPLEWLYAWKNYNQRRSVHRSTIAQVSQPCSGAVTMIRACPTPR